MYHNFFGFREGPFNVTPDPRVFYSAPIYQRTYANLLYGIRERKGVGILTGEAGTGKTTILRRLMQNLEHTVRFAYCPYTTLPFAELLNFVCDDLELPQKPHGQSQQIEALYHFFITHRQHGQYFALFIDEAHNLQPSVLVALAQLANFTVEDEVLLPIVLAGQSELEENLSHPAVVSFKQTIAISCQLDRLKRSEVGPYIFHRLRAAGCDQQEIFPPDVVCDIAEYSQGIPRDINTICDNALMIACIQAERTVTRAVIAEVAKDLQLPTANQSEGEKDSSPYRPEVSLSVQASGESAPQPAVFPALSHQRERSRSLFISSFFPQLRPQLIIRTTLSAVGILLILFFSRSSFFTTSKPAARHEPPLESASATVPSLPTSPSPSLSSPNSIPPQHPPSFSPGQTHQQSTGDFSQRVTREVPPATVHNSSLVANVEQKKKNADSQRNLFTSELSAQAEKIVRTLPPGEERAQGQQLQEKGARKSSSVNSQALLAPAMSATPQGVKAQMKIQKTRTTNEEKGSTSLIVAVMHGHTEKVQELLKNGADVNEQNASGRTALMLAALAGRSTTLRTLLNNGAAVDAKNSEGWTALMYAAWNGHTKIVWTLVRNGAKTETKNSAGATALTHALRNGHHDAARILRTGPAVTDIKNLPNKSAGVHASRPKDVEPLVLLRQSERR